MEEKEGIIEKYKIDEEGISVEITIKGVYGKAISYQVAVPQISTATNAFLEEVKKNLISEIKISIEEMLDPRAIEKTKDKFREKALVLLQEKMKLEQSTKKILLTLLMNDMLGLGDIEFLIADPALEEIVIPNSLEYVRVYHKKHGWLDTNIKVKSEEQIMNYSSIIARRAGRQISILNPILDAHLVTGDRANAVLYPVCTKGNTVTIRKFARDPWTIIDFINNKTTSSKVAAMLWLAIQYEMNILVSGGTASGKTSLLNVMMPFIPPNQRVVTIEQTRELQLPSFLHWCPLVTRLPNPEGKGEVNMLDLLVNSLRMRPDRIVLGEIRRKEEAEVLFEAMHTGHSVYATVHADSLLETITRLVNPPISVPENLLRAVNLCAVMFRDRRKGIRRLFQLGEFMETEEAGGIKIRPNMLFRYKPVTGTVVPHAKSLTFMDSLNRTTGMTMPEINQDLAEKENILNTMAKKGMRSVEDVGKAMYLYYLKKEEFLNYLKKEKIREVKKPEEEKTTLKRETRKEVKKKEIKKEETKKIIIKKEKNIKKEKKNKEKK